MLGNRMFLNMKAAGEHGVNGGTDWVSYTASSIHFMDGTEKRQYVVMIFLIPTILSEENR